ncbi:MAG: hypothetical protein NC313_17385 [Butyrivibrio sp.]|nr:hypothetical protein [Butyrivibrio sp.]
MEKGTISAKIVLEGEEEYLQALDNIKSEIRSVRKEYEQLNEVLERTSKLLADSATSLSQNLHDSEGK